MKKLDLCTRCKRIKSIRKLYKHNFNATPYRCTGPCDRCGTQSLDLWPMIEKGILDRLSEV